MMKYGLLILALLCVQPVSASDKLFADPAQETRARALFSQLRCVVCDGQSLSGSNAKIAIEMRNVIRTKIHKGQSDTEILEFFKNRYGDDVLMTPPISAHTYVLWFAPALFLLLAFIIGYKAIRR